MSRKKEYAKSPAQQLAYLKNLLADELQRMQPATRAFYERVLDRCEDANELTLFMEGKTIEEQVLSDEDYDEVPVPIRDFIFDDYYLGRTVGRGIYPRLVDDLEELFAGAYTEVLLTGGIGWGKSRFAEIGIAYELYQTSCLRDPAKSFGLMSGSTLAFVNVSVTLQQSRRVLFDGLAGILRGSPYFIEVFPYDKRVMTELRFPKNVICYPTTASPEGVLGEGIYSAAIDEANFMEIIDRSRRSVPGDSGLFDQADAVYQKVNSRIRSRMNQKGRVPGHIYLISAARYPGDFTERMERKSLTPEGADIFVRHYPSWGTRPRSAFLSGSFQVEVGDLARRSRVLQGDERDVDPDRVIEVPNDFEDRFRYDPERSVRDFAGVATLSIKPFLVRREMIRQMFEQGTDAGLRHPFSVEEATLQHKEPDYERLLPQNLHWVLRQKKNELGNPKFENGQPVMEKILYPALYHAHFDLSKTGDATGFCVGHVAGKMKCRRFDEDTMQDTEEIKPIIRIDWIQRIVPPPHGEIDIPRVRALLYMLTAQGMEFGSVTCDTFGSQESVKMLKEKGYRANVFSLDGDKDGYSALKDAIYDGRVLCYENPVLERELAQLEDVGKKIDHPSSPGSSKDLADCLAGVVHHCEEGWRHGERIGGMFEMGIVEYAGEAKPNPVRERAISKIVDGKEPLTDEEENAIMFGDLRLEVP